MPGRPRPPATQLASARLPDREPAADRERAELGLLPHRGLLRQRHAEGAAPRRGRSAKLFGDADVQPLPAGDLRHSRTTRCVTVVVGQTFHGSSRPSAADRRRHARRRTSGTTPPPSRSSRRRESGSPSASSRRRCSSELVGSTTTTPIRVYQLERPQCRPPDVPQRDQGVLGHPEDRLGRRAGAQRPERLDQDQAAYVSTSTTPARTCTWSCSNGRRDVLGRQHLLDKLSNETMLAIAKGCSRSPARLRAVSEDRHLRRRLRRPRHRRPASPSSATTSSSATSCRRGSSALTRGEVPIHEPGLDELIARNGERLRSRSTRREAVDGADFVFVCVDTPPSVLGRRRPLARLDGRRRAAERRGPADRS